MAASPAVGGGEPAVDPPRPGTSRVEDRTFVVNRPRPVDGADPCRRRVVNGAIPHTPDGGPLLGPTPGVPDFWMCCGTSFGIAQGGGSGKYLAQWMLHGDAEINMTEFDPRRYGVAVGFNF